MSSVIDSLFGDLPTDDVVEGWRASLKEIRATIRVLHEKEATLERLIAAYTGQAVEQAGSTVVRKRRGQGESSWIGQLKVIAQRHPEGISYDDVRLELPEPFASLIKDDPAHKSFYGAMRRLEARKEVVRYHNHLFTLDGFKKYRADVEAGKREPVQGYDRRTSPIQEALKAYLAENPRSKPKEVKDYLASISEFRLSMTRNTATIYNILNKLKDRHELVKHEDGSYSLADENEAPLGNPVGASETEEAPTSSFDTSPLFREVK